jgi:hypothetical protein
MIAGNRMPVVEVHRVLSVDGLNTLNGRKVTPIVIESVHPEMLKELRQ